MDDRRPQRAVTAGRIGLLLLALATCWGAVVAAGDAHGTGAVLVAAPAVAATNPHPTATATAPAAARLATRQRVSRDEVRAAVEPIGRLRTQARRHAPR